MAATDHHLPLPSLSPEPLLMMRTLRDMNTAKLAAEDAPLFAALVGDLFPGLTADAAPPAAVLAAVKAAARARGLTEHGPWLEKCMQLHDSAAVRHGIMLVGPSGSGKTAVCDTLAAALTDMGTKTVVWRMNPKVWRREEGGGRREEGEEGAPRPSPPLSLFSSRPLPHRKCLAAWTLPPVTGRTACLPRCGGAPRARARSTPGSCSTAPSTPSGSRT